MGSYCWGKKYACKVQHSFVSVDGMCKNVTNYFYFLLNIYLWHFEKTAFANFTYDSFQPTEIGI